MNILVLGSGGREHAISTKLAASPNCSHLYISPGNAGTAQVGTNVSLDPMDFLAVETFARDSNIDLIVVGPEAPLAAGIADFFAGKGIPLLGPTQAGAALESSKAFAKTFMADNNIPTAAYRSFQSDELAQALAYVSTHSLPVVVKASGLAAGKGVLICESHPEAETAVRDMLSGTSFGTSGQTIVIEQFLKGIEVSVFVLTDGENYKTLPTAKDYKRIGEGDTGLNTGGMGAVSPVPFADATFMQKVESRITIPTLEGLKKANISYNGFIFIGLMNVGGDPYVIEYNVRMGDPETEAVFPLLDCDLPTLFLATAEKRLDQVEMKVHNKACVAVMLVSGGYPGNYEKGKIIRGLDSVQDSILFHAGTREEAGQTLTNGGRVIAITSLADDIPTALKRSLKNAEKVDFAGKYYRKDIGQDLL